MLRELTEALDAFTTECPLVLVLEDLHWSDRATLEWLAYVARRPDPARLMILGTYRPVDAIVQAHPLRTVLTELQQHGQCVELALDYLSDAEVAAYLRQRFGDAGLAADLARCAASAHPRESPVLDRRRRRTHPSAGGARGTRRVGLCRAGVETILRSSRRHSGR